MTNQEAFDKMMEHLRSLKERSVDSWGDCVYNGSKCAVGILMTDEEQEKFGYYEGDVEDLLRGMLKEGHKSTLHGLNFYLLEDMQVLHDQEVNWSDKGFDAEGKAEMIANKYNLTYTKP